MDMQPTTAPGALAGIRVIDLSRVLGGPYCGQILGDHGADVLKVEPPQGDDTRAWGPPFQNGVAAYYMGLNRNKLGTRIDLGNPDGQALLMGLLEGADVLIENFKTGTLERWGMGYAQLSQKFPRLIHCRISGFGADGPLGGLAGYDAAIQAMTGLMSVNGEVGGRPLRVFFDITVPMIAPAMISGWLLAFTLSLDDVVISSFVSGPGATTLPMLIFSKVRLGVTPDINALATVIIVLVSVGVLTAAWITRRQDKRSGKA